MSKKNNRLFDLFCGEYVSILTKMTTERSTSTPDRVESIKMPVSVQGFLVEADDLHYYLGISPELITQAICISDVIHIEISQEEANVMEQLLLNGEVPPEDKFN